MKQYEIINQLKNILAVNKNIETAILYGSFARKTPTVNSDIDIATVVTKYFNIDVFLSELESTFSGVLLKALKVELRNKIVLYFHEMPKVEIAISQDLKEFNRNYLGSEILIEDIKDSILFDKSEKVLDHLQKLTKEKNELTENSSLPLIDKFMYEFESCSNAHQRSDGYKFYFFYNIAFHTAIQLNLLSKGEIQFNFLPKNLISNILTKEEQKDFYSLKGSLFLPEANEQKKRLLEFFYLSVINLVSQDKLSQINQFCEAIFKRDFLWNFRDISLNNSKLKSGVIFRSSTMTLFQSEDFFDDFLKEKNIQTVIDFRAQREVEESYYSENSLTKFKLVHAPFDPWNQSIEFQNTHHQGTNIEIAYHFFILECKDSIKRTIEAILQEQNATTIHCYAGKDRTGIFISILHLLSEAELETVYTDYLATEMDTKKEYLDLILKVITEKGGVESYLKWCGLSLDQISLLKEKIIK